MNSLGIQSMGHQQLVERLQKEVAQSDMLRKQLHESQLESTQKQGLIDKMSRTQAAELPLSSSMTRNSFESSQREIPRPAQISQRPERK